jgi:hypothetical protein
MRLSLFILGILISSIVRHGVKMMQAWADHLDELRELGKVVALVKAG